MNYTVYDTTRCWKEMERNTDMLPIPRTFTYEKVEMEKQTSIRRMSNKLITK